MTLDPPTYSSPPDGLERPGAGINGPRADIEGLRALAILLVVLCHCGIQWFAGGFIGVDVFFVLSGYLITGQLAQEYGQTSRIDLAGFYARRVRRLVPAAVLVLLVTILASAMLSAPQEMISTGLAAAAAGVYLSNAFFDSGAADYFAADAGANALLHTWSLGVEEQFYLVCPLLILLASRGAHRGRRAMWTLAAVGALSFACSYFTTGLVPTFAFYELPSRAWEFAAGGLLALWAPVSSGWRAMRAASSSRLLVPSPGSPGSEHGRSGRAGLLAVAGGSAGIVAILGTAMLLKGGANFPGWIALFPVLGTLAVLFSGTYEPKSAISIALSCRPLTYVGARSYAWYLWHWPFLVFSRIVFPDITPEGKVAAAIGALLAAAVTRHFVEQPVRTNRYLRARSGLSLGGAAAATVLIVATSWNLAKSGHQQLETDERLRSISAASADIGNIPKHCYSEGSSFDVKLCEFGAAGASPTLVLFGDSHAMQWINAFQALADSQQLRLITIVRPGCAASDINPHNLAADADHCKHWRSGAIQQIIAIHPLAVVMASYDGATVRGDLVTTTLMPTEEIRSGSRRTLERFSQAGIPAVVLRDSPLPPFNIPACVARHVSAKFANADTCDFDASVALNGAAFIAEQAAAEGLKQIHFLDMNDLICTAKLCPATQGDLVVYRDENHLTGTFAGSLAPLLQERLFALLGYEPATARATASGPPGTPTRSASRSSTVP